MQNYKGYSYFKDVDELWKVIVNNSQFIVALDDSKLGSERKIIPSKNNKLTCKKYIDWLSE